MLNILFFGQLKDVLKTDSIQVGLVENGEQMNTVAKLRNYLQQEEGVWNEYLACGKALVAVNQELTSENTALKEGDEVAFFPPVTGG